MGIWAGMPDAREIVHTTDAVVAQKTSIQAREGREVVMMAVFVQVYLGSRHCWRLVRRPSAA